MSEIEFLVPAIPVAQPRQRHRIATIKGQARSMCYLPAKHPVNAFKAAVQLAAQAVYQAAPLQGPLRLEAVFVMPRPKGKFWKTKPMPREWHAKKPDADNLAKSLKDALSGLLWVDDSQVCFLLARKVIAAGHEQPHVLVRVLPLAEEDPKAEPQRLFDADAKPF